MVKGDKISQGHASLWSSSMKDTTTYGGPNHNSGDQTWPVLFPPYFVAS